MVSVGAGKVLGRYWVGIERGLWFVALWLVDLWVWFWAERGIGWI